MITEEVEEVGKRENVDRSAKQHKHLLTAESQAQRDTSASSSPSLPKSTQTVTSITMARSQPPSAMKGTNGTRPGRASIVWLEVQCLRLDEALCVPFPLGSQACATTPTWFQSQKRVQEGSGNDSKQMLRGLAETSGEQFQGNLTQKVPTMGQVCANLPHWASSEGQTRCFYLSHRDRTPQDREGRTEKATWTRKLCSPSKRKTFYKEALHMA